MYNGKTEEILSGHFSLKDGTYMGKKTMSKSSRNYFHKCSREKREAVVIFFFFFGRGWEETRKGRLWEKMRWEAKRRWSALCLPLAGRLSSTLLNVLNWQTRVNRQLSWPLGSKGRSGVERLLERLSLFFCSEKLPLASLSLGLHCKIKNLSNHCRLSASNGHPRVDSLPLHEPRGRERHTDQQIKPMAYRSRASTVMTLKSQFWKWIHVLNSRRLAQTAKRATGTQIWLSHDWHKQLLFLYRLLVCLSRLEFRFSNHYMLPLKGREVHQDKIFSIN